MRTKERIWSIILMGVFGFMLFYAQNFPDIPRIMPTIVSTAGLLLSIGLLIKTFVFKYPEEDKKKLVLEKRATLMLLAAIGAMVLYTVLMTTLGFYSASFLFLIGLSYLVDPGRKLWQYPVVAVGILLLVYAMFSWFLKVPLPKNLLF